MTFSCPIHPKSFSFPQGYRKDNWLKVQRQSRNGSGKGSTEGNQIYQSRKVQVESSGASSNQAGGEKYRSHGIMFCPGSQYARKVLS